MPGTILGGLEGLLILEAIDHIISSRPPACREPPGGGGRLGRGGCVCRDLANFDTLHIF